MQFNNHKEEKFQIRGYCVSSVDKAWNLYDFRRQRNENLNPNPEKVGLRFSVNYNIAFLCELQLLQFLHKLQLLQFLH